ncbi:DUF72 domain-containing protein [Arenibaculum pallidiluteum]|uniref:DUF72 domain-containing protein n=1 Tax=Arenibaculum pallidiluteum TaxID=2812559 RepID=UPI001A9791ED|nr:DUF72 domain-containing protein [Arenibaculum pallidiluteum]
MAIRIGTSGWQYSHWKGRVFAGGVRIAGLADYQRLFDTVEINNTHYRWPRPENVASWRDGSEPGFLFAVKAHRLVSHRTKLNAPAKGAEFVEAVRPLGPKLGPVLFQMPDRFGANPDRLAAFLDGLPRGPGCAYAFEFRDRSWLADPVFRLLEAHRAAAVIYDIGGFMAPEVVTAPFVYLRFHGPGAAYRDPYGPDFLADWAGRIRRWDAAGLDVYCYFDNDMGGHAVDNALDLLAMVRAG